MYITKYTRNTVHAGLVSIGCLVGSLLAGPVMEKYGRRFSLIVCSSGSFCFGFFLMLFASSNVLLYIGRLLNGVGLGFVMATSSVYIIEICSPDMRGLLGCFIQLMWSIGVLVMFILGCFLNWWQLILAKIVCLVPYVLGMYISPESPRWLFLQGKDEEGRRALRWLRGDIQENILEEKLIRLELQTRISDEVKIREMIKEPGFLKPFLIAVFIMFFRNMSGMGVIIAYCNTILKDSGTEFDANLSSITVGIILVLSCLFATLVLVKFARKAVLVISMFGMGLSFTVLGFYFQTLEAEKENSFEGMYGVLNMQYRWVPCTAILALLFLGNSGYGTLVWVVIAEILPKKTRSLANSIIIFIAYLIGFISTKSFIDLTLLLQESGAFYFYSAVCMLGAVFTIVFVPETRGKSLQEIELQFSKK
ncbi:facilitated trehalose transporter Tret1-2 homolog isoform X3 [Eurytemora carolleeae]|uniref:facilitated trehalose transporter Tret1-2 homolog isoform X3 n=1 Tax=Eurytemora carolleeae TaxID=1294199 RepID=UPI000C75AB4E|nr:facilitated trehalose transporter Tret1-2 homolog isoform X3 [Eurytemora carolleeae]|eukprot:XP_023336487.1 facilitated trehalose transporter Tret1-2 homolog isoform X3 [Eurytemora affinis]